MESRKSLLNSSSIEIAPNFSLKIPTVGEILEDEYSYYNIAYALTASPFQYMVQLDDIGVDYTQISSYEFFKILFFMNRTNDLSLLFGDLDISQFDIYLDKQTKNEVLYNPQNDITIDELVYNTLADMIRKINMFEKVKSKPGNESAKRYLLEKERKRLKRNANKKTEQYLEKLVIALVNTNEFSFDYDTCMDLSIYRFNQSFKQIQHKINFDNTMTGVYSGTIDTSKMNNKDSLSWIPK